MLPAEADDNYEDDLDARLAGVLEEKGIALPPQLAAHASGAKAPSERPQPRPARPPGSDTAPEARDGGKPAPPTPRRSGRREKTLLLGMLGTLAGAFAGVLSMKLFVPRPPAGAGPDVHVAIPGGTELDLVDPPDLTAPPQAPPSKPDPFLALGLPPAAGGEPAGPVAEPAWPARRSAFAAADEPLPGALPESPPEPGAGDATSRHASADRFGGLTPVDPPDRAPLPPGGAPSPQAFAPPSPVLPAAAFLPADAPATHLVREGDSWWGIAERAYGDGRYYKALVAWNRALDPRTALVPGSRLDIPPEPLLRDALGRLLPPPTAPR